MEISVIVPIYNEVDRLAQNAVTIHTYLREISADFELILVNDGSTDGSASVMEKFARGRREVKTINLAVNRGKGGAVKEGVLAAKKALILFLDADLATPITELPKLLPYLSEAKIVIGSRAAAGAVIKKKQSWYRVVLGRLGNWLIRCLLLPDIRDTQCGFKLLEAKIAKRIFRLLTVERWGFDFELLFLGRKFGAHIREVPVTWSDQNRSKITAGAYGRTLLELLKIKLNEAKGLYDKGDSPFRLSK